MARGKRWAFELNGDFYETDDVPAGAGAPWSTTTDIMKCIACFDVKKEDGEVKKGSKGVGACVQKIKDVEFFEDANFFGTIEAQGADSF